MSHFAENCYYSWSANGTPTFFIKNMKKHYRKKFSTETWKSEGGWRKKEPFSS